MASRFLFHSYAVGVSGRITRPVDQLIQSQAASALAPAGGYSSAREQSYQLLEILSHGGASSEATGSQNPANGNHESSVTATVQDLNIGNVVVLESCTARLSSIHPADGSQARITPQGSSFTNLRIAGRTIQLESRIDLYSELDTLDKLRGHYGKDEPFRNRFLKEAFAGNENALHEKHRKYFPWRNIKNTANLPVTRNTGATIVPLFVVLNPSGPGFHVSGNVITVENFGTIVLGELVISGYERRVTMLHVEMGSPIGGDTDAAIGGSNGTDTDPP